MEEPSRSTDPERESPNTEPALMQETTGVLQSIQQSQQEYQGGQRAQPPKEIIQLTARPENQEKGTSEHPRKDPWIDGHKANPIKAPTPSSEGESVKGKGIQQPAIQRNKARAEKILANMGHITKKWENIDGAATHRSVVQSGIDPKQPLTIQEQLREGATTAERRQATEQAKTKTIAS